MKTQSCYIVTIEGSDVPPGWREKIEKKLRDDLRLSFGSDVSVRQVDSLPPPDPKYVHVVLKNAPPSRTACGAQFGPDDDVSWTSERFQDVNCPPCRTLLEAGLR